MKKAAILPAIFLFCLFNTPQQSYAHFGMTIPSDNIVEQQEQNALTVNLMFTHPFEGQSMNMEKPVMAGVLSNGKKTVLTDKLKALDYRLYADTKSSRGWKLYHQFKRPGDHIFFMEPVPYWEPAENSYIVHYTKVIVNAFGKEDGWDEEVGMKTEIIPLTRPYGLYTGNVFQGVVQLEGKPIPFAEVEVEHFNRDGKSSAPAAPFVTQVVKADSKGIFTYAIPKSGWWGFAALSTDRKTIIRNGKPKPVEIGAVLWVKAEDFK